MANRNYAPVGYQKFRTEPLLSDGLLPVARPGGQLLEQASAGLFRLADQQAQIYARQRQAQGVREGEAAALAGRPEATIGPDGAPAGPGLDIGGGSSQAIAMQILRHEEGYRETPYWDVNADRVGYGSDTITGADGKVRRVTKADRVSKQDAERDLARRTAESESHAAAQVGEEHWGKLPAEVRAALTSVTYNYGSLPGSVTSVIQRSGGDRNAIASAVAGLGSNPGRRKREASIIAAAGDADAAPPAWMPGGGIPKVAGGTFRPTGEDTVYGRAYDEAGAKTYLQEVDTEMRSTASQLFDKYKDDPAGLSKAYEDLHGALLKDHVFPEIRADFDNAYGNLTSSYLDQARKGAERKAALQDRADFVDRTSTLETTQQKQIAAFDPKSTSAADAIASSQQAIDAHYDDAVKKGIMDPDDAEKAKIASRREAALGFYGKQADSRDADGVKAMHEAMRKDFTDGGIAGLDGDAWHSLDTGLDRLEEGKRRETVRATKDFRDRGDSMAARIAAGLEVDKGELAQLMVDSGTAPEGKATLQETMAKISAGRAIRDMNLQQGASYVNGLQKQYGEGATPGQLRTLTFAAGMLESKRKAVAKDAVSYAEAQGIVPATPMLTEAKTADELAGIVEARAKAAGEAADALGTQPRFLKAGEAKALGDAIRKDPKTGASIAAGIVAGAGPAAKAMLAEFGHDAPMVAEAGSIIAFGGSAQAAEDVILGYGKDENGKAYKPVKPAAAAKNFGDVAGDALGLAREDANRIGRAAASIARKRIADEGVEPDSDEALAIHKQAVNEAAGAVFDKGVQFGGFADYGGGLFGGARKVLVPSEIRADRFDDVVQSLTDADLAGLKVKPRPGAVSIAGIFGEIKGSFGLADTLKGATPVAVQGGYAFAAGDPSGDDPQWIGGDDGKLFVLDVLGMRNRLGPRVPGAFR